MKNINIFSLSTKKIVKIASKRLFENLELKKKLLYLCYYMLFFFNTIEIKFKYKYQNDTYTIKVLIKNKNKIHQIKNYFTV